MYGIRFSEAGLQVGQQGVGLGFLSLYEGGVYEQESFLGLENRQFALPYEQSVLEIRGVGLDAVVLQPEAFFFRPAGKEVVGFCLGEVPPEQFVSAFVECGGGGGDG